VRRQAGNNRHHLQAAAGDRETELDNESPRRRVSIVSCRDSGFAITS
jgi:hypothetical protein